MTQFAHAQPIYAEHRIATFPVDADKHPMVKHYGRFGLVGSAKIAGRFADAPAIGFMCGKRNGITVLDVDTTDERVLADAVDRHGRTPIITRSGSGHFQAWYRHAGERRLIRPRRDVPIDILGGGFVVAPPSTVTKGSYQFLQGSPDDLEGLPTLHDAPTLAPADFSTEVPADWGSMRQGNGRNSALFRLCLKAARHCDGLEQLLDYARTKNDQFGEPMEDQRVIRAANSAWKYESEGRNYIGGQRAVFSTADVLPLMPDPYLAALIVWAKASFKPGSHFWLADGLAEKFGWSRQTLKQVRRRAVEMGAFRLVRRAGFKRPAVYTWGLKDQEPMGEGVH
jgi:Bifunctional DNA primase/polymerase, N-terminal/Primase C terminal 1 (PriCT-1)